MNGAPPTRFTSRLVGLTFTDRYPDWTGEVELALSRPLLYRTPPERVDVVLIREPDNQYDSNAIAVFAPLVGQRIGHIDRRTAALLAPAIDSGQTWEAWVADVIVRMDDPGHPGVSVSLLRTA